MIMGNCVLSGSGHKARLGVLGDFIAVLSQKLFETIPDIFDV
jgi:hypothetical protein